jgi:hypothetical protein
MAKTKDGNLCQIPARTGQKYCHVHRKQRLWRIIVSSSAIGAIALGILGFIANITGILDYLGINLPAPATPPNPTSVPALFPTPSFGPILKEFEIAGYSKQTSLVRDSTGKLTAFIRNDEGDLGYISSIDAGTTWSAPTIFDKFPPPGGPHVSAVVDSANQIHVVWGHVPEAGNAEYGLLADNKWIVRESVGTGVFARDIAVDSANHPHVTWTNIDLFYTAFNGQRWSEPRSIAKGAWHPDIQVTANDDIFIFTSDGGFYPTPNVSVYVLDNINIKWNAVKVSTSPFWSSGAVGAIDSLGNIYLAWIGASTAGGGHDQVFFSRFVDGGWQTPFQIGEINTSAGSTGQESPSMAFDANDVLYVFWRGLNDKNRPVIFARAYVTENSKVTKVTSGWSPLIQLDDRSASDVWWPSVADTWRSNRIVGVDVVWTATIGTDKVIEYSHVVYP